MIDWLIDWVLWSYKRDYLHASLYILFYIILYIINTMKKHLILLHHVRTYSTKKVPIWTWIPSLLFVATSLEYSKVLITWSPLRYTYFFKFASCSHFFSIIPPTPHLLNFKRMRMKEEQHSFRFFVRFETPKDRYAMLAF